MYRMPIIWDVKQLFKDLIGLNAVKVRKTNWELYHY